MKSYQIALKQKYDYTLRFNRDKMVARKTMVLTKEERRRYGKVYVRVKIDDEDYQELYDLEREILEDEQNSNM